MRVKFRDPDMSECPEHIELYSRQFFLTPGKEYQVYAINAFDGIGGFLIIDDLDSPSWESSWLFVVTESSLPADWICNSMIDWPELIVGPSFIAHSQEAYSDMTDLDLTQVQRLRQYIKDSSASQ